MKKALFILIILFAPPQEKPKVQLEPIAIFNKGYSALNIPFEISPGGKIYIYGRINGSKRMRILLDSGAATMLVFAR